MSMMLAIKHTFRGLLALLLMSQVLAFSISPQKNRKASISKYHANSIIQQTSSTTLFDKWDDLDDEDDELGDPLWRGPPIPRDMKYNKFNLKRQYKIFNAIRGIGGPEMTNDVYARDPDTDMFWFCGKVARISDVSVEMCVARQYPLIEEHSARLRPRELFDKNGLLELWVAPGDSEMDVAYNRPTVQLKKMLRAHETEGADDVKNSEVGFQGEIYEGGEEGFRTQRTEDGMPLKPEIVAPEGP